MNSNRFNDLLKKIRGLEEEYRSLTEDELKGKTAEFKDRYKKGESLDSMLCEAFAAIIEADFRVLGERPYDVQVLGGIALHKGYLIEMNTGEGKTLTATMPIYLNAISGKSAMLVTANAYLAYRDAQKMGEVYRYMGLTVMPGVGKDENEQLTNAQKKQIYSSDIVYTTHGVLGFDYLLNNLVTKKEDRFLCEFNYVIVDEADMVLLDAAQMPLVISGSPRVQSNLYETADFFVTTLKEDKDYEIEDEQIWLTKEGVKYAEDFFGIGHYYSGENFELNRHITLALRAHGLMEEGKDYIVSEENTIVLMDQDTGRAAPGMRLGGGQHQALEAKEHLEISQETRSVAAITYQNFYMMFPKFSGMSGTISDAKRELKKIYKKDVVVIPPNRPLARVDYEDKYFQDYESQFKAAIDDIIERHSHGQPVLIVTSTIADTEIISRELVKHKISHNVLNANNVYWEAQIIKEAGQKNAVTVSTGMAGRGTDIKLGKGVSELGGLAVIGIGRMDNIRLERQVRGRAGRQGDPGSSQYYVSLEDEIVVRSLGDDKVDKLLDKDSISKRKLKRLIDSSRKENEENGFTARDRSLKYDKVMKYQRNIFYDSRNRILDGEALNPELLKRSVRDSIKSFVINSKRLSRHEINRFVLDNFTYTFNQEDLDISEGDQLRLITGKKLTDYAEKLIDSRLLSFKDPSEQQEYMRLCALQAMDAAWVEEVDYLQQLQFVVSGRQTAQKNPIYEYQNEAYEAFQKMQMRIKSDLVRNFLLGEARFDTKGKMYIIFP